MYLVDSGAELGVKSSLGNYKNLNIRVGLNHSSVTIKNSSNYESQITFRMLSRGVIN